MTDLVKRISVSDFLCEALVANGVTHVFGGHGGAIVGLIDAIVTHPKLTWVYARCEGERSFIQETSASACDSRKLINHHLTSPRNFVFPLSAYLMSPLPSKYSQCRPIRNGQRKIS